MILLYKNKGDIRLQQYGSVRERVGDESKEGCVHDQKLVWIHISVI